MVEFQPSKLVAWVRFPSLAPIRALSSVDRVPGYEPVGRRFESSRARHKGKTPQSWGVFSFPLWLALFGLDLALASQVRRFAYPTKPRGACSSKASADIFAKGEYPPTILHPLWMSFFHPSKIFLVDLFFFI